MPEVIHQNQLITIRFVGRPGADRLGELEVVFGAGFQIHDPSTPLMPDSVVVTVSADTIVESGWMSTLVELCGPTDSTVGVGLLNSDRSIRHAGGIVRQGDAAGDQHVEPFGAGCVAHDDPLFTTDRLGVALLAPYAQWITSPGAGAAALANPPTGHFVGGLFARSTSIERVANTRAPVAIRVADAAPNAILVEGTSGHEDRDHELLADVAATRPVVWRRPPSAQTRSTDPQVRSLATRGVFEFDVDDYSTDGLAAAFEVDQVLHLDDEVLNDGSQVQQLLRARPNAQWAVLANRSRPGVEARCEVVLDAADISRWAKAGYETRDHTPSIRDIAAVDTRAGVTSVVIPVHGMWQLTKNCLAALDRNTTAKLEIVVVDDASLDDTANQLAAIDDDRLVVVTNETNVGFPASVNNGIAATTGEFVCVLNNDTEVTTGWLDELQSALAIDRALMVGPRSNEVSGIQRQHGAPPLTEIAEAHAWATRIADRQRGETWRTNRLVGFCLLARRSTFVEFGGFDDGFGQGNFEDDELSNRLRAAGGDLRVANGSIVLHHGSATFASLGTDYLTTLASAARHHRAPASLTANQLTCLVLSNGDHDATESTVWSLLGLGHHFRVVERRGADLLALRLARAQRLGVEIIDVDWTTVEGAANALRGLDTSDTIMVFSAGEIVEVTDWGAARAELERHVGSACGVLVDGQPQVRAHPPTARFMDRIGEPTDLMLTNIQVKTTAQTESAIDETEQNGLATVNNQQSPAPRVVPTVAMVLSEGVVDGLEMTVESALSLTDAVIVLDRSGEFASSDNASDPTVALDWSDETELARYLDTVDAEQMLILATGERLVVDSAGWAADLVLKGSRRVGIRVGDHFEIRVTACSAEAVGDIGLQVTDDDYTSRGLRIIPPGLPHSEVTSLRFPELGSPAAMAAAMDGVPPLAERLAESLVMDEDLRMLDQIRAERPIDWSGPEAGVEVGVVVVHDPRETAEIDRLDDTLSTLLDQSHPPHEIVVVTPPGVDLNFSEPKVRQVEHFGLDDDRDPQSRQANLGNLGALVVEGDWIAVVDAGDKARPDHIEHLLAVAYADQSEYVHGLAADTDGSSDTPTEIVVRRCDERQGALGTLGPLLFASEYRALQLRPTSVLLPEHPGAN
ncbi:MAG: glycosyltransferase, partial [Actinobacteria bacterium]|nr:glycosyltransferase [Actinomycetota bacterium]